MYLCSTDLHTLLILTYCLPFLPTHKNYLNHKRFNLQKTLSRGISMKSIHLLRYYESAPTAPPQFHKHENKYIFLTNNKYHCICKAQFHWVTFSYPIEQHVICIYKDVSSRFGRKITNGNRFQIRKNDTISIPIKNKSNEGVCSLYCRVQLGHQGRQHVIILIEKDGINCFLWESWIIIRHFMLHKYCTHTIQNTASLRAVLRS